MQIVSPSERVKTLDLAHSGATTSKDPLVVNSRVLIPLNDADADELNAFVYEAELDAVAAETGVAWSVGDALYWDDTNNRLTKTSTSNTLCAHALEAKASATAVSGLVAFDSFTAA